MDVISFVITLLTGLAQVPAIGKILVWVVGGAAVVAGIATAVVSLWHAAVVSVKALSQIPGLQGLVDVATHMSTTEAAINDFENNSLLPILNRISVIPLPKAPN